MEFRDLKRQYRILKDRVDERISQVISSGCFIGGEEVAEIESRLENYLGIRNCISCGNGTDALTIALKTLQIGEGDAVFVPSFTFFATAEVVAREGATPVFVDVDKSTFNISCHDLEQKIQSIKESSSLIPRAIVAVDLFGLPADFLSLRQIASQENLFLVEDGAQGFGGSIQEKKSCSFGDIATTSFFPSKPLGCYGDGGAVFTDNDEWAALARSLSVHGKGTTKYDNVRVGMNSRLDAIQAAVLNVKLTAFQKYELAAVQQCAQRYGALLKGDVLLPQVPNGYSSSWANYTVRFPSSKLRDSMRDWLQKAGIPTMVYYPKPLHLQKAFEAFGFQHSLCPNSEELCKEVLSLPIHPYMTEEETNTIIERWNNFQ